MSTNSCPEGGFSRTGAFAVARQTFSIIEQCGSQNLLCAQEALSHRHTGRQGLSVTDGPAATGSTYVRRNGPTHYGRSLLPLSVCLGTRWYRSVDEMTEYPTEESCLAKLEAGGGSLLKVPRRSGEAQVKALLVVHSCGKQFNPAEVEGGGVRCHALWWRSSYGSPGASLVVRDLPTTIQLPSRYTDGRDPFAAPSLDSAIFLKLLSRDTIRAKEVAELLGVTRATAGQHAYALRMKVAS